MAEEPAPLVEVFESLARVLTTSSRDWGAYWADAWLYGVLVGWDCEEAHEHDGAWCGGDAATRGMAEQHGWSEDAVARLRRYRAAVRAASAGFEELRAATRQHIAAVYGLPAEMVAGWDAIDKARVTADIPVSSEETSA